MLIERIVAAPAIPGRARGVRSLRGIRLGVYAALLVSDAIAIVVAMLLGGFVRFGTVSDPSALTSLAVMLPVYFGIAIQRKPYSGRFLDNWRRTARDAVTAFVTASIVATLVAFYLHAEVAISRSVMVLGGVFGGALLIGTRWTLHRVAMALTGGEPVATVIVADGVRVDDAGDVAVIDGDGLRPELDDPHALDRLSLRIGHAERVIVACRPENRDAWAAALTGANVQGEIILPELAALGVLRTGSFEGQSTAVVSLGPLDTTNRILKRGFDLAVSLGALAVLWPLMAAVAIAIRLDSPGPVLFRQTRMGRGNRLFPILKFRSMRTDACDAAGDRSTGRTDDRVTRVGRIIRATSIDELPQLLNVVRGEMSIVGPRPHALGSLAGGMPFWAIDARYWNRHAMKPGITGLAQVHGFRGATEVAGDLENRLRSDLAYLRGWTVWRDVRLVLATARVLLHRNAY